MMMGSCDTAGAGRRRAGLASVLALTLAWQILAWQVLCSGPASAEDAAPQAGSADIAQFFRTTAEELLRPGYSLDGGTLSISELRPGATDPAQLRVYLAMLSHSADPATAIADPALALLAALGPDAVADLYELALVQTAAAMRGPVGLIPRSQLGADGAWEFPRLPDTDERDLLVGLRWRVVENEESQLLFLGPDGEFGFDDFLDLVNPLQHIPLINVGYRALTGDEIYGAARLLDLGMGPAAGVSTVFDLALESTTGETMEDRAIAALFGLGDGDDSQQFADRRIMRHGSNQ